MEQSNELTQYGNRYSCLKQQKDELESQLKTTQKQLQEIELKLLELMELQNMKNFELKNVGKFFLYSSSYPRVIDNDALFADLRQKGDDALIKETIHPGTLRAYVKEQLENQNTIPKGVEVFIKNTVRFKKGG